MVHVSADLREHVLLSNGAKRRRGSETDSLGTDTDLDEAFTAADGPEELPSPSKKRRDDDHGFSRLSLSQASSVQGPDSPVFEDEDVEEEEMSILHPLIAEAFREPPPPLIPLRPDKEASALVLYQPVLRTTKPDEIEEAESDDDETPIVWPGQRRKRRTSLPETITIDIDSEPWPRGPALRVGTPRPELPPSDFMSDAPDAMDVDEEL